MPVIATGWPPLVIVPKISSESLVGPLTFGAKTSATLQLLPGAIEPPAVQVDLELSMLNPLLTHGFGHLKGCPKVRGCDRSATPVIETVALFLLGFVTVTNLGALIASTRLAGNFSALGE